MFSSHSSLFALKQQAKNLTLQSFLPLRDPLVATCSETHAPTFRKFAATEGILMPNASKTFQSFLADSSVFALKKTT